MPEYLFVSSLGTDGVKNSFYSLQKTTRECTGKAVIESDYEFLESAVLNLWSMERLQGARELGRGKKITTLFSLTSN